MTIPTEVAYTTIVGRITRIDPEQDVLVPVTGTVVFEPTVDRAALEDADGPFTAFSSRVRGALNADGYLTTTRGARGVRLLATGDAIPSYTATFLVDDGDRFSVTFTAPEGDVDITTALKVPADPSSALSEWENAANRAEAAASKAQQIADSITGGTGDGTGAPGESAYQLAVDEGFTGSLDDWLDSLKGAPGPSYDDLPDFTLIFENGLA